MEATNSTRRTYGRSHHLKGVAKVSIELALQDEMLSQDVSKEVTA
jgi:hypothetical protein